MSEPFLSFSVPGQPIPKGRPRFTRAGRTYTPERTATYERELAIIASLEMGSQKPLDGPVCVEVIATFTPPVGYSHARKTAAMGQAYIGKIDADNLLKIVGDALNGIVWLDDRQIVEAKVSKVYGDSAKLDITVRGGE